MALINDFDLDRVFHGNNAVNFSYSEAPPSAILAQTFNTVSGATYNVRFAFGAVAWDDREASLRFEVLGADGTSVLASRTLTRLGNNPAGGPQVNPAEWTIELEFFTADGSSATLRFTDVTSDSLACDALLDYVSVTPVCAAQVQPPINADGSSIFNVRRGVVPVKFTLTCDGSPTCDLPPATIAVTRTGGGVIGEINESVYSGSADSGSNFRTLECQYHYNLNSRALGVGTYRVDILIDDQVVGSAIFQLE